MTNLALILVIALAAERLVVTYFTWAMAKRKGRLWFAYAIFGLVGYIVLALRSPDYSALDEREIASRPLYTHTGFGRPGDMEDVFDPRRKRRAELDGYHLPRGVVPARARS